MQPMRDKRYRVKLPLIFGAIALLLIAWDLYNESVVMKMWRAGVSDIPLWPYHATQYFIISIFAPAYVGLEALPWKLNLQDSVARYAVALPCMLALMWWVGLRLDHGILPTKQWRFRWLFVTLFRCIGVALVFFWFVQIHDQIRWWLRPAAWNCGLDRIIVTATRDTMFTAWMLGLAVWAFVAGKRLIRLRES